MIKWFVYIVLLLIFAPFIALGINLHNHFYKLRIQRVVLYSIDLTDTTTKSNKKQVVDDKGKIKEVTKTKKQPKPEKVEVADNANTAKQRPKRVRRPEGIERPPEIPRRNGN